MNVKKLLSVLFVIFLFTMISAKAQNALVVVAHGAPGKQWNEPVLNLENEVKNKLKEKNINGFTLVRVALMEFSEPTVDSIMKDCESQHIRNVYVIPLFIAPSSHSEQDVPNILGLKYNPDVILALKEEGTSLVNTDMHITVGPTLSYCSVIKNIITDRIKAMSKNKNEESFILLAHGDPEYLSYWNNLMKTTGNAVAASTEINFAGYAFVGMGQNFYQDFLPIATKAAKGHKRVIVQGVYLSNGLNGIKSYALKDTKQKSYSEQIPKDADFLYGENGLLPDSRISDWIADRASEWINNNNK